MEKSQPFEQQEDQVILVDSNDQVIGVAEKMKAHQEGLLHRAFSIFIYKIQNDTIEFLLQQRHIKKYHSGGLWTNTCCSHPRPDEDIILAGQRRLKEELSLSRPLKKGGSFEYRAIFENGLIEHELDHILIGEYQGEPYAFDPKEIQAIEWMTVDQIKQKLIESPHIFTPWFQQAFHIACEELCYLMS
jgi:isopentenyl-diphosphate delta-isomerase type 1